MECDDLIYRRLQKHLDRMPVGFPESKTGADIRILKGLFTEEEAVIALELSMLPENAERIYPRLKHVCKSVKELETKLDDMFEKGLIMGGLLLSKDPAKKLYSNAQYVVGIHEFQAGRVKKNVAPNMFSYTVDEFTDEFLKDGIPAQMRTIPVMKSIIRENYTDTYDNVRELIQNTNGRIVIHHCVCRDVMDAIDESCKASAHRETCMSFRVVAERCIEAGFGRIISKEEALSLVHEFEENAFVVQPQNNMKPEFICFCCGCCCGVLKAIKKIDKPATRYLSNYFSSVDPDVCAGCETCITRCQMDAVKIQDGKAIVDPDRCIGCGLCTTTCKTGAMTLNRKDNAFVPAKNQDEMYKTILMKKIGPLAAIKTMVKYKLGMKV